MAYRRLIEIAVVELVANPSDILLAKYGDASRARQIERLFKPTSFLLGTNPSPTPTPLSKKMRLNMNVTCNDHFPNQRGQNAHAWTRAHD